MTPRAGAWASFAASLALAFGGAWAVSWVVFGTNQLAAGVALFVAVLAAFAWLGRRAPRPDWAMAAPGVALLAFFLLAFGDTLDPIDPDEIEDTGGPTMVFLFALVSAGFGMVEAGAIALGVASRGWRRPAPARVPDG